MSHDKKIVYVKTNVIHDMIDSNNDKNIIIIHDHTDHSNKKQSKFKKILLTYKKTIISVASAVTFILLSIIIDSRISDIIIREQSVNNLVLKYMKNNDEAADKTLTLFVTNSIMKVKDRLRMFDDKSTKTRYLIYADIDNNQWVNWQSYRRIELTLLEKQLEWSLLVNGKKIILESIEENPNIDQQSSDFRELVDNTSMIVYSSMTNSLSDDWQEMNGINLYNTFISGPTGSPLELPFMLKDLKNTVESVYIFVINNNKDLSNKISDIRGNDLRLWLELKKRLPKS